MLKLQTQACTVLRVCRYYALIYVDNATSVYLLQGILVHQYGLKSCQEN